MGRRYNVVFEYVSDSNCMQGIRFLAKYPQKSYFENFYNDETKKKQRVVAKGVSHLRGLKMVHDVPLERYYDHFILTAYDHTKKIVNVKKFSELLDVLITSRNGFTKSAASSLSPDYHI